MVLEKHSQSDACAEVGSFFDSDFCKKIVKNIRREGCLNNENLSDESLLRNYIKQANLQIDDYSVFINSFINTCCRSPDRSRGLISLYQVVDCLKLVKPFLLEEKHLDLVNIFLKLTDNSTTRFYKACLENRVLSANIKTAEKMCGFLSFPYDIDLILIITGLPPITLEQNGKFLEKFDKCFEITANRLEDFINSKLHLQLDSLKQLKHLAEARFRAWVDSLAGKVPLVEKSEVVLETIPFCDGMVVKDRYGNVVKKPRLISTFEYVWHYVDLFGQSIFLTESFSDLNHALAMSDLDVQSDLKKANIILSNQPVFVENVEVKTSSESGIEEPTSEAENTLSKEDSSAEPPCSEFNETNDLVLEPGVVCHEIGGCISAILKDVQEDSLPKEIELTDSNKELKPKLFADLFDGVKKSGCQKTACKTVVYDENCNTVKLDEKELSIKFSDQILAEDVLHEVLALAKRLEIKASDQKNVCLLRELDKKISSTIQLLDKIDFINPPALVSSVIKTIKFLRSFLPIFCRDKEGFNRKIEKYLSENIFFLENLGAYEIQQKYYITDLLKIYTYLDYLSRSISLFEIFYSGKNFFYEHEKDFDALISMIKNDFDTKLKNKKYTSNAKFILNNSIFMKNIVDDLRFNYLENLCAEKKADKNIDLLKDVAEQQSSRFKELYDDFIYLKNNKRDFKNSFESLQRRFNLLRRREILLSLSSVGNHNVFSMCDDMIAALGFLKADSLQNFVAVIKNVISKLRTMKSSQDAIKDLIRVKNIILAAFFSNTAKDLINFEVFKSGKANAPKVKLIEKFISELAELKKKYQIN